jgi:hypothetical protein
MSRPLAPLFLALSLIIPAAAATEAPLPAPDSVVADAEAAAEALAVAKVFAGLRLGETQLRELLPLLEGAQTRLRELERSIGAGLAAHTAALTEVRARLYAGKPGSERAETAYDEALKSVEKRRKQLRADLVATTRRALERALGPRQESLVLQTAASASYQQRTATYRAQWLTGEELGGPIGWMGRIMDRNRGLSREEFERDQTRHADQDIQLGRYTTEGAARLKAMMERVRALPARDYEARKAELALEVYLENHDVYLETPPPDPQREVDRFLDRYFLSPHAPTAARVRLGIAVPRPASPPGGGSEAARVHAQIRVLRALAPLRLRPAQSRSLLEVLEPGVLRWEEAGRETVPPLAAVIPRLREAAAHPTPALEQPSAAELEYLRLKQLRQTTRDRARAETRNALRAVIEKELTAEQRETIRATGGAERVAEYYRQWQVGEYNYITHVGNTLDQLRRVDTRRFADDRLVFAMRMAEVGEWRALVNRNSAGRGPDGTVTTAMPAEVRARLQDGAVQARIRPLLQLADRVRSLSEPLYRQERPKIALQVWRGLMGQLRQANPSRSEDAFFDHYFLSPAALAVLPILAGVQRP